MDVRGEIAKMLQDMAVKVVKSARQELLERHPKLAGGELIWKNIGTLARDERLVDSYQLDGRQCRLKPNYRLRTLIL